MPKHGSRRKGSRLCGWCDNWVGLKKWCRGAMGGDGCCADCKRKCDDHGELWREKLLYFRVLERIKGTASASAEIRNWVGEVFELTGVTDAD